MTGSPDAIVVGSGPNGLAAAVTLGRAGLRVLVLEGAATPGGGCRTEELTLPGYRHDVCSAVHPLAAASPFFSSFGLGARGVRLLRPEVAVAHPLDGGGAGFISGSVAETAAGLGLDGRSYQALMSPLVDSGAAISGWVLSDQRRASKHPLTMVRFGSRGLLSADRLARRFASEEARGLVAGIAAHAMVPLSASPTAGVALLLAVLGHQNGWPLVEGGSSRIVESMVAAIGEMGGEVQTGTWVRSLGDLPTVRAVLLDVTPSQLVPLAGKHLPDGYRRALRRFRYGSGVCKVDFALRGPVPWTNPHCRRAGTLHLGGRFEEIARSEVEVASGRHPQSPFVLVVQPGVVDPSRAPTGREALWTYCHVPARSRRDMGDRIQRQIERFAPGFGELVLARSVKSAADLEVSNPNYVGGDIGAGAQTLRQTFLRPVARWNSYRTGMRGVYLCSASTVPGPGVHGRCGELAARTALADLFGPTAGDPAR